MSKYKVGTETINGKTDYFVIDTENDVRIHGSFDTERWAQAFIRILEDQDEKHIERS